MANRRQQVLDAVRVSLEDVEPAERTHQPNFDDWGDDYDAIVHEWALYEKAKPIYKHIKKRGITPKQWLQEVKNTLDNQMICSILEEMADDERDLKEFFDEWSGPAIPRHAVRIVDIWEANK